MWALSAVGLLLMLFMACNCLRWLRTAVRTYGKSTVQTGRKYKPRPDDDMERRALWDHGVSQPGDECEEYPVLDHLEREQSGDHEYVAEAVARATLDAQRIHVHVDTSWHQGGRSEILAPSTNAMGRSSASMTPAQDLLRILTLEQTSGPR